MEYASIAMASVALIVAIAAGVLAWQAKKAADPVRIDSLDALITQQAPTEKLARAETQLAELTQNAEKLKKFAGEINARLDTAVQGIGLARFNANGEIGGELSFALTMVDARHHGFILTSITDHHSTRLFIRGIINGVSQHPLLPNEETSLQQALNS